ncbi:hypothetical protein Trydic_g19497 [Trypoxylus dichotomus]
MSNVKDRTLPEDEGVYETACSECDRSHVEQTNRRIKVRREKRRNVVFKKEPTSLLAQHRLLTGHTIDFDNTKILTKNENLTTRIIREAIETEKRPKNLNKQDDGQRLPHT